MNNAAIPQHKPSNAPASAAGLPAKSPRRGEEAPQYGWEAFSVDHGFEWALHQPENVSPLPSAFTPPQPAPADDLPAIVTPSQWPPLQCELLESMENIGHPPFSFSLQLPQLGDIDVMLASLSPQGWDIALRFSREAYQLLKHRREACRRSLCDALGCPVRLSFDDREER